jgi:hypothetical protein
MKDEELKLEDIEGSSTLCGSGEVGRGEGKENTHYLARKFSSLFYACSFIDDVVFACVSDAKDTDICSLCLCEVLGESTP